MTVPRTRPAQRRLGAGALIGSGGSTAAARRRLRSGTIVGASGCSCAANVARRARTTCCCRAPRGGGGFVALRGSDAATRCASGRHAPGVFTRRTAWLAVNSMSDRGSAGGWFGESFVLAASPFGVWSPPRSCSSSPRTTCATTCGPSRCGCRCCSDEPRRPTGPRTSRRSGGSSPTSTGSAVRAQPPRRRADRAGPAVVDLGAGRRRGSGA